MHCVELDQVVIQVEGPVVPRTHQHVLVASVRTQLIVHDVVPVAVGMRVEKAGDGVKGGCMGGREE